MIETITLLIDNTESFLNYALYLASECSGDRVTLADSIQGWLERSAESWQGRIKNQPKDELFYGILMGALGNVSDQEWQQIAQHYLNKFNEQSRYRPHKNWVAKDPLV